MENSKFKKNKRTQQHLVYIKNLDQFMRKRTGVKHMNSQKRELCLKCLNFFKNEELLKRHKLTCYNPRGQAEFYPEPGQQVQFKNWNRCCRHSEFFLVYFHLGVHGPPVCQKKIF